MDKIENEEQYVLATQELKNFKELWRTITVDTLSETKQFVSFKINNLNLLIQNYLQEIDRKKLEKYLFTIILDLKINHLNYNILNNYHVIYYQIAGSENAITFNGKIKTNLEKDTLSFHANGNVVDVVRLNYPVRLKDYNSFINTHVIDGDDIVTVMEKLNKYIVKEIFKN